MSSSLLVCWKLENMGSSNPDGRKRGTYSPTPSEMKQAWDSQRKAEENSQKQLLLKNPIQPATSKQNKANIKSKKSTPKIKSVNSPTTKKH